MEFTLKSIAIILGIISTLGTFAYFLLKSKIKEDITSGLEKRVNDLENSVETGKEHYYSKSEVQDKFLSEKTHEIMMKSMSARIDSHSKRLDRMESEVRSKA